MNYFIEYRYRSLKNKHIIKKRILCEILELYQIGAKILFFFNKKAYLWFEYPRYFVSIKKIADKILKLGKLGMIF